MSNEYKEWELDRKDNACSTIITIVDIIEKGNNDTLMIRKIKEVLKEDGWI